MVSQKPYYTWQMVEKEAGLEKMEQAIQVLSILDCKDSADYYKQGLQELLKESWKTHRSVLWVFVENMQHLFFLVF